MLAGYMLCYICPAFLVIQINTLKIIIICFVCLYYSLCLCVQIYKKVYIGLLRYFINTITVILVIFCYNSDS